MGEFAQLPAPDPAKTSSFFKPEAAKEKLPRAASFISPVAASSASTEAKGKTEGEPASRDLGYADHYAETDASKAPAVAAPAVAPAAEAAPEKKEGTTSETTHSLSSDRKKWQDSATATTTGARTTTKTTVDAGATTVDQKMLSASKGPGGTYGAGYSQSHEESIGEGEEKIGVKNSTSASGSFKAGEGGGVKLAHTNQTANGENKNETGAAAAVGIKKGHLDANLSASRKVETAHGATETEGGFGVSDNKVNLNVGKGFEHKRKVNQLGDDGHMHETELTKKNKIDGAISYGPEGFGAEGGMSHKGENDTTHGVKAGVEVGEGKVAATAGYSMMTKDGHSVGVSFSAGVTVETTEPEKVGDRYVVSFKRSTTVGGGASASYGPMSGHAEASHAGFTQGTRSFKELTEAKEFKEHAAEIIRDMPDPRGVTGALALEIGESRGTGGQNAEAAGAAFGKVVTVGVDEHAEQHHGVDVRRLSANVFEVTASAGSSSGHDLKVSMAGLKANNDHTKGTDHLVKVRFDLSTKEGQTAFEEYCRTQKVPASGGKLVSTEDDKADTITDGMSIPIFGSSTQKHTIFEKKIEDDAGTHEQIGGTDSTEDSSGRVAHFFGSKDHKQSTEIVGHEENGKAAGYSVEMHVSGESGSYNRDTMQRIKHGREDGKQNAGDAKASGEWTMSADITEDLADRMLAEHPELAKLKHEDRMRAVAEYVAHEGISAVNDIGNHTASVYDKRTLDWDVELKGNPSFPGRAGRMEIDSKLEKYGALIAASASAAPVLVGQLQGEVDELEKRRADVSDPKKYTDLPDWVRASELQKIEAQVGQFEALRHQCAIESMKMNPGESTGDISRRVGDEHAHDKLPPEQKRLAELRDQIANLDGQILYEERHASEASAALGEVANYDGARMSKENLVQESSMKKGGEAVEGFHKRLYTNVDAMRLPFIKNMGNPAAAIPLGESLLDALQVMLRMAMAASQDLDLAAQARLKMMGDKKQPANAATHEDYYMGIRAQMEADEADAQARK